MRQWRGGCDTRPPLQRARLSSGGNPFREGEHSNANCAAAKQCPVTFMCGNGLWEREGPAIPLTETIGDITSVRTVDGWVYTVSVIDLRSRKVIGSAVADPLRTSLSAEALAVGLLTHTPRPA